MRRIAHSSVHSWLLLATVVGLCGCPLLLDDDFSIGTLSSEPDAGDPCIGPTCHVPYSNVGGSSGDGSDGSDAGESGGSAGQAGSSAGGSAGGGGAGNAGSSGAAGSAGAGNSGGSAGSGSAGAGSAGAGNSGGSAGSGSAGAGSAGTSGDEQACWTLEMTDGSHDSGSNCLGITGNNILVKDTGTTLTLGYEEGDPCFTGTLAASGWGATYEFGFATGSNTWDADAAGVTGFEFAYRGNVQPPTVRVMYKDPSGTDNCRTISPGTTSVPFSAAHPSCSTNAASPVVDSSRMDEMILAIIPQSQALALDFCVQIRALD